MINIIESYHPLEFPLPISFHHASLNVHWWFFRWLIQQNLWVGYWIDLTRWWIDKFRETLTLLVGEPLSAHNSVLRVPWWFDSSIGRVPRFNNLKHNHLRIPLICISISAIWQWIRLKLSYWRLILIAYTIPLRHFMISLTFLWSSSSECMIRYFLWPSYAHVHIMR